MPNHCTNKVSIIGSRKEQFALDVNAAIPHYPPQGDHDRNREEPEPVPFSFHAIVPIPSEILCQQWDPHGYNWQRKNWGTKWGAYDFGPVKRTRHAITYTFDTAGSPPLPVLAAASYRWGVVVAHSYHEECPSRGRHLFVGGKSQLSIDESYNGDGSKKWRQHYFDSHSAWIRDVLASSHMKKADELFPLHVAAAGGDSAAKVRAFLAGL